MSHNLANLPPEQRQAIEQDKQRWNTAAKLSAEKQPPEIRTWLARQSDEEFREDMRRRLNVIRRRNLEIKN